jgi:uncharacterized membrane protein
MWTRAQLKDKAKAALKMHYWKMVLVALLLTLLTGGLGSVGTTITENFSQDDMEDEFDYENPFGFDLPVTEEYPSGEEYVPAVDLGPEAEMEDLFLVLAVFLLVFLVAFAIGLVIGYVFTAFLSNPLVVGSSRFFLNTLGEEAQIKDVAYAFDHSYMNVVKVMFFRTLYTSLWTFLFIIPGIIKSYEYRMIPYLLAENPNLTKEQAFALSKQMMMGQKWNAFVLDLSFTGWYLLSICTCGILEIFYVAPYVYATNAALYEELSCAYGHPAQNTYVTAPYQPVDVYQPAVDPYETNYSYENENEE